MAEIETRRDLGKPSPEVRARFWHLQIKMASKGEEDWRKEAGQIYGRYRREKTPSYTPKRNQFNILWANTETLKPAVYDGQPEPDVRRRHRDADPIGREVAVVAERALSYSIDEYDFDDEIEMAVQDALVVGRGVARVRYIPTFEVADKRIAVTQAPKVDQFGFDIPARFFRDDNSQEVKAADVQTDEDGSFLTERVDDDVVYEECKAEVVPWDDFRMSPAKRWRNVWWIAFRHRMTRDELVKRFGPKGKDVRLDWAPPELSTDDLTDQPDDAFLRATVWEIWDKRARKVHYVADSYEFTLADDDDPLGLEEFFPIPRPMMFQRAASTMVPAPEFRLYKDQADELDRITARIDKIISVLKVRGVYAATMTRVKDLLKATDENVMIPIEEWNTFTDKGGLDGVVDWLPIDRFAEVLTVLYQQRAQLMDSIFQIVGISDIMRGATDPRETKGAQQFKAQFGVNRVKPKQREVARFVRDVMRLKVEIMGVHFSADTIGMITGKEITQPMLDLIENDGQRGFRIDIETDSTIAPDEEREKREVSEFLTALGGFQSSIAESGMPPGLIKALTLWAARRFKVSREVEDQLEQQMPGDDAPQQPGQDGGGEGAEARAAEAGQAAAAQARVQGDQIKAQASLQGKQIDAQADLAEAQLDARARAEIEADRLALERDRLEFERAKWEDEVSLREREIEASRASADVGTS